MIYHNINSFTRKRLKPLLDATSGEEELLSSSSAMKSFPTYVKEIVIQYPE